MTDLEMVSSPDRWPNWPVLPMKHRRRRIGDEGFCGVLVEPMGMKVYLCNLFELPSALESCKVEEYQSIEALLADWQVD